MNFFGIHICMEEIRADVLADRHVLVEHGLVDVLVADADRPLEILDIAGNVVALLRLHIAARRVDDAVIPQGRQDCHQRGRGGRHGLLTGLTGSGSVGGSLGRPGLRHAHVLMSTGSVTTVGVRPAHLVPQKYALSHEMPPPTKGMSATAIMTASTPST